MESRMLTKDRSTLESLKRYDLEFHHALLSACGSRVLIDAHGAVFDKYHRYLMIAVVFRGDIAPHEHRQLLDCALKRDSQTAQKILTQHINECVTYTLKKWPAELGAVRNVHAAKRRKVTSQFAASV
jgi:DNA-binding GntR family transcriptional regulator